MNSNKENMNEISYQTIGNAINGKDGAVHQRRHVQASNMARMAAEKINRKYSFKEGDYLFFVEFRMIDLHHYQFYIVANNINGQDWSNFIKDDNYYSNLNGGTLLGTGMGAIIDNLKAGNRFKLKEMGNAIDELNRENNTEEERGEEDRPVIKLSENMLRRLVKESVKQILDKSFKLKEGLGGEFVPFDNDDQFDPTKLGLSDKEIEDMMAVKPEAERDIKDYNDSVKTDNFGLDESKKKH